MAFTLFDVLQSGITIILSSGIAYLVSRSQKRLEHEYDYRKYILEKRKKVYDQIEIFISHLTRFKYDTLDGEHCHVFMLSADDAAEFEQELVRLLRHSYWMTNEIAQLLTKTNLTLLEINSKQQHADRPIDSWGKEYFKEFYKLGEELRTAYFLDLMHLNDLSLFKKNKLAKTE